MASLEFFLYKLRWSGSKKKRLVMLTFAATGFVVAGLAVGLVVSKKIFDENDKTKLQAQNLIDSDFVVKPYNPITDRSTAIVDARYTALEEKFQTNPDDVDTALDLIGVMIEYGNRASGLAMMRANDHLITKPDQRIRLGRHYMQLGLNEQASQRFSEITRDDLGFQEAKMLLGEAQLRLRNYNEAMRSVEAIAGSNEADFLLARLYYVMGKSTQSKLLINEIHNRLSQNHALLGRVRKFQTRIALDENDLDRALKISKQSVTANQGTSKTPDTPETNINTPALKNAQWQYQLTHLEALIRSGEFDEAERVFSKLESHAGDHPSVLELRAQYYAASGQFRRASQVLDGLKNWSGGALRRPLLYAYVKREVNDLAQARRAIDIHLSNAPNDWLGLSLLANFHLEDERFGDLEVLLDHLDKHAPSVEISEFFNYKLALIMGNYDRALDSIDAIISDDLSGRFTHVGSGAPVAAMLIGLKSRAVRDAQDDAILFREQLKTRHLHFSNQPQKALKFFEDTLDRRAAEQTHPLDQLIHGELLLENFREKEAQAVLSNLPESARKTRRAALLALRINRRSNLASSQDHERRLHGNFESVSQSSRLEGDEETPQLLQQILLMDAIRLGNITDARAMVESDWNLLDNHSVFLALGKGVIRSLGRTDLPVSSQEEYKAFAHAIAIRGYEYIDQVEAAILVGSLFEVSKDMTRAKQYFREAVLKHSNQWPVLREYLRISIVKPEDRRAASAFLKALAENTRQLSPDHKTVLKIAALVSDAQTGDQMRASLLKLYKREASPIIALALADSFDYFEPSGASKADASNGRANRQTGEIVAILKNAAQAPDLDDKLMESLSISLARFGEVDLAASLLEGKITSGYSNRSDGHDRITPLVKARGRLVYLRADSNSNQSKPVNSGALEGTAQSNEEKLKDIFFARWAIMLIKPGFVDYESLEAYALALERGHYDNHAVRVKREIGSLSSRGTLTGQRRGSNLSDHGDSVSHNGAKLAQKGI